MNSTSPTRNADGYPSRPVVMDTSTNCGNIAIDAAMFYSMVSLIIAILVAYFRQPFGSPGVTVIASYWVSGVAAMLAYAGPFLLRHGNGKSQVIALTSFFVTFALVTAGYRGLAVAVVSIIAVGANLRAMRQYVLPSAMGMTLAAITAAIFATACFFLVNSMDYATVFSPERALAGVHHRDQLFHASIASMFAHYGIAGTGLNGLQPFRYHLLSHIWLGMMAKGFGVNSIFGYFLGMQIIAVPLAYFSVTVAAAAFVEPTNRPVNRALMLVVPITVLFAFEQWNWLSYLVSESHILGLILLLTALPMLRSVSWYSNGPLPYMTLAISFVVGLLALAAKVSVGFVWFAGFFYLLVRIKYISRLQYALCAVLSLFTFWIAMAYLLPIEHSDNGRFAPFHFFKLYPTAAIANLVPIILATALQIARWRSSSPPERLWRETIVIMLLTSAAPTFLLQLDGGSAYYFINIGAWISVAALAGQSILKLNSANIRLVIATCIAITAILFLSNTNKSNALGKFITDRNQLAQHVLKNAVDYGSKITSLFDRTALFTIAQGMKSTVGGRLSHTFESIGLRAGDERLIFIEPDVGEFWSMHTECEIPQFLVPSYFGVPLLKGLPPVKRGCELGIYYSFPSYGPEAAAAAATDSELCRAASGLGFSTVVRVTSIDTAREVVCSSIGL